MSEFLEDYSIEFFGKLKSKQHSLHEYDGNYYGGDLANMFKVRADGKMSVTAKGKHIYVERWDQHHDSPKRVFKLSNQMEDQITMINADFDRDFVVSGDCRWNLMIQRISKNQVLFNCTQFFSGSSNKIICSSIMNDYLCIGGYDKKIGTINLRTFSRIDQLTFDYDSYVNSVNICKIKDQAFVIVTGRGNNITL